MTSISKYPVTRLAKITSKGGYYYVQVTKPADVFKVTGGNRTVRKSTGSRDRKQAESVWRSIERAIYDEWDKLLERDPFLELLQTNWKPEKAGGLEPRAFIQKWGDGRVLACQIACMAPDGWNLGLANKLFNYLSYHEALDFRSRITAPPNPYPTTIQNQAAAELKAFIDTIDGTENNSLPETRSKVGSDADERVNLTGCPTILAVLPDYLKDRRWANLSRKEHQYASSYITACAEIIGDKPLDQILARDAKVIMETLSDEGLANSTIKTYKRHLSTMLNWAITDLVDTHAQMPKSFLTANPFVGISAKGYGTAKRSYEALSTDQLHRLFSLDMPDEHWLLLSILVTTGMRLDEAALLTWSQYKIDRNGLRYFDLSTGAVVKNDKFSARTVAIPDCLELPKPSTGRIFSFKIENDGKSSKSASRAVSPYFHAIRDNENDDRKVAHSLRHNLTGLMANLTDPVPSGAHMDWITGHDMEGNVRQSERTRTYLQDIDVSIKHSIVNRVQHPWLQGRA